MKSLRFLLAPCTVFLAAFAATPAGARPPEWAVPLLETDVTELGREHRIVRLADISLLQYGADQRERRVDRGALRVMTEAGRRLASCQIGYNADTAKVLSARAWILSADGKTETPVAMRDFVDGASRHDGIYWPQQRVFRYSAHQHIEVGGALVWEIEVESQTSVFDETWSFPHNTPTLLSLLEVTPAPGTRLLWHASSPLVPAPEERAGGVLRWEVRNHRPGEIGDRPDRFLRTERFVCVRTAPAGGAPENRSWATVAALAHGIIDPQLQNPPPEVAAKAAELTAGRTGRWDRIRALVEFVRKEITYLSITLDKDAMAGYRPHKAGEVLQARFGDCKDKATLLIALLRAIGEDGLPMLVFSGNPKAVLPEWPSPRFNHMIACIPADAAVPAHWPVIDAGELGRFVLVDPTSTYTPLGLLPIEDQGGHGLIVSPRSTELVQLPVSGDELTRAIDAEFDARGNAKVRVTETLTGNIAARERGRRVALGQHRYARELEQRLQWTIAAFDALTWSSTWDSSATRWDLTAEFTAPHHGRKAGPLLLVTPQILRLFEPPTPWTSAVDGVVWSAPRKHRDRIRMKLPDGVKIDALPEPWQASSAHVAAAVRYRQDDAGITYEADIDYLPGYMDKPAYDAARKVLLDLELASRRPIVFR